MSGQMTYDMTAIYNELLKAYGMRCRSVDVTVPYSKFKCTAGEQVGETKKMIEIEYETGQCIRILSHE